MRGCRAGAGIGLVVLAALPACGNDEHPGALPGAVVGGARIVAASTTAAPAATSTSAPLPATTVPPAPPTPGAVCSPGTWELSEADLDEPFCPERSDQGPRSSGADPEATIGESTRLEPMLGIVLAYGTDHADSFGSYGLHWHEPDDASVFISFTHDVAAHRAALVGMVPFPEELTCAGPRSPVTRFGSCTSSLFTTSKAASCTSGWATDASRSACTRRMKPSRRSWSRST